MSLFLTAPPRYPHFVPSLLALLLAFNCSSFCTVIFSCRISVHRRPSDLHWDPSHREDRCCCAASNRCEKDSYLRNFANLHGCRTRCVACAEDHRSDAERRSLPNIFEGPDRVLMKRLACWHRIRALAIQFLRSSPQFRFSIVLQVLYLLDCAGKGIVSVSQAKALRRAKRSYEIAARADTTL